LSKSRVACADTHLRGDRAAVPVQSSCRRRRSLSFSPSRAGVSFQGTVDLAQRQAWTCARYSACDSRARSSPGDSAKGRSVPPVPALRGSPGASPSLAQPRSRSMSDASNADRPRKPSS
jgi:hypothetical protein